MSIETAIIYILAAQGAVWCVFSALSWVVSFADQHLAKQPEQPSNQPR